MILLLCVICAIITYQVLAGIVSPDQPNPIVPYRNNQQGYSQYDIYVAFQTRIPSNGQIEIVFPQEYDPLLIVLLKDDVMIADGLAADTCPIEITFSTEIFCAPSYSKSSRTLKVFFNTKTINAGSHKITIKYNQNPITLGGKSTGYFQINTYNQGVLIDQNLNFGTVGFALPYVKHTIIAEGQILNDGSNLGGYVTNYVIVFTTTIELQIQSWFRAEIATGFGLSGINCVLIDTGQDLGCTVVNRRVFFGGITAKLPIGQHKIKLRNVINPTASGSTEHFVFETLEPKVNTVLEYYFLDPVYIKPGQIINPSIAGAPLNKNLRVDYTIKFTPMNSIPRDGKIVYTLPLGYKIDPTCRIISGLTQIGTTPITCTTDSDLTITITGFDKFDPQEITLKIFAINPPTSKLYTPCTIKTYSTFGTVSTFKPIDQNLDAGSIQISEIESPYFVAIDLYRQMANLTLSQLGPLDFRLYPQPTKQLSLTNSATNYGEIYIQLPLWWRLQQQSWDGWYVSGATPTCNFGAEVSSLCQYYLQIFKFRTPTSTNYLKYFVQQGLGQCDLPISLANVIVTPIPGRWDFRVITLQDGTYNTFNQVPIEQDLYTMDIAVDPFPAVTYVKCTSKEDIDTDVVCYSSLTVGLPIPYEGAINMNVSAVNSTYESSSAWPWNLGFGIANDTFLKIPCTVIINGAKVGYAGTLHPKVVCYVFSGGLVHQYSIFQVRGFSSVISSGSTVMLFIPDIQFCSSFNMNCYITLNSAYTTELYEPYILNLLKTSVAWVKQGSGYKDVSTAAPTLPIQLQDATLSATFTNFVEICRTTTWTFTFTAPTSIMANRDHILIKMPRDRFPYQQIGTTSNAGQVYLIDHFRFNQLYYFIIVTNTMVGGGTVSVTLGNVRNAIDPTPGVVTYLIYWVDQQKQRRITFPISPVWQDGGILNPTFQVLPKFAWFPADRQEAIDMDFDSWIIFQASFQVCHLIASNGLVELEVQGGLQTSTATCEVWQGVTSAPLRLGYTHQCNLVTVAGKKYYHITLFNDIPVLTQIIVSYRGKTVLATSLANQITIQTYFNAATRISTPGDATNVNDYYNSVLNGQLNGIDITGPKTFPTKLQWKPFIDYELKAREGTRGEFYMHITSKYTIVPYNTDPLPRLTFTFNTTGITIPGGAYPHCRINGHLCRYCEWVGGTITMSMPLLYGMTAELEYLVMISTRGADASSSTREGLHHVKAGRYTLRVATVYSSGVEAEFTYKVMDVEPPKFRAFWVWSSNKIAKDPINNDPLAGKSMYRIFFNNPSYIPPSDNPNPVRMILQFHRIIWPTFDNGFEGDLKTGLPHRTDLPCIHLGFTLLPLATKLKCRLFIGSYPNPTKVIITDFAGIPAGTNGEIHLPNVWNPNSTYQLTKVSLTAELVDVLTGNTQQLLQNEYSLINGTFGRTKENPAFNQISIDVVTLNKGNLKTQWPAAVNPSFAVSTIDTMSTFTVQFGSKDHIMGGGADLVIFEIPPYWELPYGLVTCAFGQGGNLCYGYPAAYYIGFYLDSQVAKNTLITGTIQMKTPPFKIIVATTDPPIKIYVYTRSKLVDVWQIDVTQVFTAVPVVVTAACTVCKWDAISDYTIKVNNLKNIPAGGAIEIKYPPSLVPRENGCRNDLVGGSELSQTGFMCTLNPVSKSLIITGFPKFVGPGNIIIKIRMENPASPKDMTTEKWFYNSWYVEETPFNKLITYGDVASPALTAAVQIFYWDTPYRSRTRARNTKYGSLEFRINLKTDLLAGSQLDITLPFSKIRCAQFLCLWDKTPWFDNHNDNFLTSEKCLFNSVTSVLSVYTPLNLKIDQGIVWRLIIDTENSVDGKRGFLMPLMNTYLFTLQTTTEMSRRKMLIPQAQDFTFFECVSLITNSGLKNMFSVQFTPATNIPGGGGYLTLFVPTLSEEGAFLFDNDLGTGKKDGDPINCYARSGFVATVVLTCTLKFGNQVTGAPAEIKITGWVSSLTAGIAYIAEVDEFKNPTLTGDDKHMEMRLESRNAANGLLDQGFSYDFTLKYFAYTTPTLAAPTTSTFIVMDQSLTMDFTIATNYQLLDTEYYDYYVFEFTKPVYGKQPHTAKCYQGATQWACTVTQGHNWIIIKPKVPINVGTITFKFQNVNNPEMLPILGVQCIGYAVKDRIVTAIYTYNKITTLSVAKIGATSSMFVITPLDYIVTEIPKDTITRYQITITTSPLSLGAPYGSVVDIYLPTGFLPYENCYNNAFEGSQMLFTTDDNLYCQTSTSTYTGYVGRPQFSYTSYDTMPINQKQIFTIYVKTPNAAVSAAASLTWYAKVWLDSTRTTQLFDGELVGPAVQAYGSFKEHSWLVKRSETARKNSVSPLIFSIQFKTIQTPASLLVVSLPNSVTLPTGATLFCTIEIESSGLVYQFAYCSATGTLDITMQFPVEPATFAIDTWHKITINSRGSGIDYGLQHTSSGILTATFTMGVDTGSFDFEILPASKFSNTRLRIVNSHDTKLTSFIVNLQTTITIPIDGSIVLAFPTENYADSTITYFSSDITNTVQVEGALFPCYTSVAILKKTQLDCRIYKTRSNAPQTELVISNFPQSIPAGSTLSFVFEKILIKYNAKAATIPLLLYSADSSNLKLEALMFYDHVAPVPTTVSGLGNTMSPTFSSTPNQVQGASTSFTFGSINAGTTPISPFSSIVFQFPVGQFDLTGLTLNAATTAKCLSSGSIEVVAHYAIYTQAVQPATTCSGTGLSFVLSGARHAFSNSNTLIYQIYICQTRACTYTGSVTPATGPLGNNPSGPGLVVNPVAEFQLIPWASVSISAELPMTFDLPSGSIIILWHPTGKFQIEKIVVTNGVQAIQVQRAVVGANNEYSVTLLSDYSKATTKLTFNIYGRFAGSLAAAPTVAYKIGFYTRYQGFQVTLDATFSYIQQIPGATYTALNWATIQNSPILMSNVIPGTSGNLINMIHVRLPVISSPGTAPMRIELYIDGVQKHASGPCAVDWPFVVLGAFPICVNTQAGAITVTGVPLIGVGSQLMFTLTPFMFTTAGIKSITAVVYDSTNAVKAAFYGYLTIHPQALTLLTPKFAHYTSQVGTNVLQFAFAAPVGFDGTAGTLFIDILDDITSPTTNKKLQCNMPSSLKVDCEFIPRFRLQSTLSASLGYKDSYNSRILITKFSTQTTGTITLNIFNDIIFTSVATTDVAQKHFQLGYYTNGVANYEQYVFGQNFYVATDPSVAVMTNTNIPIAILGTAQSKQNAVLSNTMTTTFAVNDILLIKFLAGYNIQPLTVDVMKKIAAPIITTVDGGGAAVSSSQVGSNTDLGTFEIQLNAATPTLKLKFDNLEMPYLPTATLGVMNVFSVTLMDGSTRFAKEKFTLQKTGDVTKETLQSCSVKQIDKQLFEAKFTLPTDFQAFNPSTCEPKDCRQNIKISATGFSDVSQYLVTCGLGTSVFLQDTPISGAIMALSVAANQFKLIGFSKLTDAAPICIRFRKATPTTAGLKTFTIAIVDSNPSDIVMADCTATFTAGAAGPVGQVQGIVKSQFGLMDFEENYSGILRNSLGQLTFQLGSATAMSTAGYFQIYTTQLDLTNFDQKKRLLCYFRHQGLNYGFYSPKDCIVDTTNQWFKVDYSPPAAANQIPANTLIELVIKYDQQSEPLMAFPTTTGNHQFTIKFFAGVTTTPPVQIGVLYAGIFDKQTKAMQIRSFYDHQNGFNLMQVEFQSTSAISVGSYIQLEYPLQVLTSTLTLTTHFLKDLGTGIKHGYKINCLDKQGNLGTNYKCNLYYGIDSFQRPTAFIRLSGYTAISSGTVVKFNIMKFKNPATAQLISQFALRVASDSGANIEYTLIKTGLYTLSAPSAVAATTGTISLTPLGAGTATKYTYSVACTNGAKLIQFSSVLLTYNVELWGEDYSTYTAKVGGTAAAIEPLDQSSVFITFPANVAAAATVNIEISTGLINPVYYNTYTNSVVASFINYQTSKVEQIAQKTLSTTTTQSPFATIGTVTCNTDLMADPLGMMVYPIKLLNKVVPNYVMKVTYPNDFVVTTGQYCQLFDVLTSLPISITCSVIDSLNLKVVFNSKIVPSDVSFLHQLKLQSTAGSPGYTVNFYADVAMTLPIQTLTPAGITIIGFTSMVCAMPYIKSPQVVLQDEELGPLRLTFKFTAQLNTPWHYLTVDDQFIGKTLNLPTTTLRYQFRCFWNNFAATFCNHNLAAKTINVYAPSSTVIAVNDIYTVFISFWRVVPIGVIDFKYIWHDSALSYVYKTAEIAARYIKTYNAGGGVLQTETRDIATQNYRFDDFTATIEQPFIAVHQTTINTYMAINLRFKMRRFFRSNLGPDWGQMILKLPTMDDWDNTQLQFPDGIGRYMKNNQEIDCLCNSCPSYTIDPQDPIAPLFRCYAYLGYGHRSAPVEIWINPQTNLNAGDVIDITIAKIKLPPTQYTYGKISLLAYEYYSTTTKYINHTEIVHDFTYQTIPDAFTTYTSVATPTFTPNLVGEPATIAWQVNNPYQDILEYCHDRWVLSTDDAEMIFEHPYNPVTGPLQTAPYNHILYTTATNHDVMIFKLAKWATFRPTVLQVKSATQTLNVQKFKNMPYQIPTGVNYKMTLFIDFGVRSLSVFNNYPTAPVNRVVLESVDPIPKPALVSQPNTYELKFLPYNKIPKNGKIIFDFPNYDWTFSDAYCLVSPNLVDSGCDIIAPTKQIIIKDWLNDYDPRLDGQVSVKFDIINPTSPKTDIPFIWNTYWNQNQIWKIDSDVYFESTPTNVILNSGILRVKLWDRFEHPYTICGGRTGPIRLLFILRFGNLVYPNDFIQLKMWYAFQPSMPNDRIVCYFNDPADPILVNIKSHRCDWDNTAGGTLTIYVPEEIDLKIGHEWELVISTFASLNRDGWTVRTPSDQYWVTFTTSSTNDKGWFEAAIPGCPFDQATFECENVGWQAGNPAGDPSWTIFNLTASTYFNNIPTGDPTVPGNSRMLFEFYTHNELAKSWPMDLTNRMLVGEERKQTACNGLIKGNTKPLQAQGNQYIECQNIKGLNEIWNNTPSYIVGQYYEQIAAAQLFHFQLADFRNGYLVGEFQHIKISIEVKQEDGTYYPQNEHYCWHAPHALLAPPAPTGTGVGWSVDQTQVNLQQSRTHFTATIATGIGIKDVIVYDYNYPYTLPNRGYCLQQSVQANFSDAPETPCTPQHYNHWFVFGVTLPKTSWYSREYNNMRNPPFVYAQNLPVTNSVYNSLNRKSELRIYIWQSHLLIHNVTYPFISPTTGNAYIVLQTTEAANPADKYVKYHVGVFLQTRTNFMKHIRLWGPSDFQDIRNCKVNRGLTLKDMGNEADQITCTITQMVPATNGWMLELDNYGTYQGDGWMIIDMELKNPNAQKWTGTWWVKTFESKTNLTYVIDETKQIGGQTWVGETIKHPNLFRVFRNTVSYENRRAQTDDYAEVHMRLIPRSSMAPSNPALAHPPTTDSSKTTVEIWLPLSYDLANGGDAVCQMSNDYHKDLDSVNCKISSDRKITLTTDKDKGLQTQCSMVTVTTKNAIGGNGIKLPSTPQADTFQVFVDSTDSTGAVRREYNYNDAYAVPDPITTTTDPTFSWYSTIRECDQPTIIKMKFTSPIDIPAGYDTSTPGMDALSKPPIGTLKFKFNTKDYVNNGWSGFPQNLGQTGTDVKCQAFASLKGTIKCTLTVSPAVSVDYPAIVEISGFNYIMKGDAIEIHFLDVKNGFCGSAAYNNNGQIALSSYLTKGDGTKIELIKDSLGYVPFINTNNLRLTFLVWTTCPVASDVIIDPNEVGAYNKITISNMDFNNTYWNIGAGDSIILTFPVQYEFPADSNAAISGLWEGIGKIQMITVVYPLLRQVYFTFPAGIATQTLATNKLIISQFRGTAYAVSAPYNIKYTVIKSQYILVNCDIINVQQPTVSSTSTSSLSLSSQFAGDVYVDYKWQFSPSYPIPAGSSITLKLPANGLLNYNQINLSSPPAICAALSTLLSSCTVTTTGIILTALKDIPMQTNLGVTLTGAKNPLYVGVTGSTDYSLSITHPNGQLINQNNFAPFTFYAQKVVGVIYMKMKNTNNFQTVSADYTFVLQGTNRVPINGQIYLKMPKAWASIVTPTFTIAKLWASWTSDSLSYTATVDKVSDVNNYLLKIVNLFEWQEGGSISILMLKLTNPNFEWTKIFQAISYYDGVALDSTDPVDESLRFQYLPSVPSSPVANFTMGPSNAGEVSTYSLKMTLQQNMTTNSTIQVQFPSTYPASLTTIDLSLQCKLTFTNGTTLTVPCSAANQRLSVTLGGNLTANDTFTLSIVGIANPNVDTSATAIKGTIDVITADPNNNILTYTSNAATISPTAAAKTMKLTALKTDSTNLQVKANYTLCVQTDQPIPMNAQVFIDFPSQFTLRSVSYPCFIGADHNNVLLPYDNSTDSPKCGNTNSLRRIAISNHNKAYPGDATNPATLCYVVQNIENPTNPGPTDNFVVSIYDTDKQNMLYKTFGTLSSGSTLSYQQEGLVITVASIDPIPRYLSSTLIKVTLERSVSHTVTLTPISTEFKFSPADLVFLPANGPVMYFKIQAIDDVKTEVGQKQFAWKKTESATAKFSEMPDSFFQYVDKPASNVLLMTIFPKVFRVALGATSLPITLTLSQSASSDLTSTYVTVKPSQDEYVTFNTTKAVFPAGTTTYQLNYTTKPGAISGQIQFAIEGQYGQLYTIVDNIVNFEILQNDDKIPEVVNYYPVSIGRTSMYFRASIDESVLLSYQVTLKGSPTPTMDQIKNKTTTTKVFTQFGKNQSQISPVTSSYIYNDVYLDIQGLTEDTDYTINFFVTDLSGNNNTKVIAYDFKTQQKQNPAQFSLELTDNVSTDQLLSSFGLITGLPASRFKIIASPPKYTIDGDLDDDVKAILSGLTVTYTIEILPDPNSEGISPLEYVRLMQQNLDVLKQEIPQVVQNQNLFQTAFEVLEYPQEFKYTPKLINVTEEKVSFTTSIRYSGKLYSLVLPAEEQAPTSIQVKMGLNASNQEVKSEWVYRAEFKYSNESSSDDQLLNTTFTYPLLFDNRNYTAYFTAENNRQVNPELMKTSQMEIINFKTKKEIVIIPKNYLYGQLLAATIIMIMLL